MLIWNNENLKTKEHHSFLFTLEGEKKKNIWEYKPGLFQGCNNKTQSLIQ